LNQDEKMDGLLKQLPGIIRHIFQDGYYKKYLQFVSRFRNFSPRNTALIFSQNPNAPYLADYVRLQKGSDSLLF